MASHSCTSPQSYQQPRNRYGFRAGHEGTVPDGEGVAFQSLGCGGRHTHYCAGDAILPSANCFAEYLVINNFALPRMRVTPWYKRSHFYLGGDGSNFNPLHVEEIVISDLGMASMAFVLWARAAISGAENLALVICSQVCGRTTGSVGYVKKFRDPHVNRLQSTSPTFSTPI